MLSEKQYGPYWSVIWPILVGNMAHITPLLVPPRGEEWLIWLLGLIGLIGLIGPLWEIKNKL